MQQFKSILAVVDRQSDVQLATRCAAQLAERNDATLKLVDVVHDLTWLQRIATRRHAEVEAEALEKKRSKLRVMAESLRSEQLPEIATHVLIGKSSIEIIREVLRCGHDLVVKQAKPSHNATGFLGTTGMRLLRNCPCPVWLVKPDDDGHQTRVLAAVDGSTSDEVHMQLNKKILDLSTTFCKQDERNLDVVQAWSIYGESMLKDYMENSEFQQLVKQSLQDAENSLDKLLEPYAMNHDSGNVFLLHGDPGLVIPKFAEDRKADLIVMGTIGRSGMSGVLMGNTAESILGKIRCSVLAVKPDGFISPVMLEP